MAGREVTHLTRPILNWQVNASSFPDSMGPQIKKAADSGIPVIVMDGGFAQWREVGGLTYVGYDPHDVGVICGRPLGKRFV